MEPAYHIHVEKADLQLIGEICAVQGQIEWLMKITASKLLGIDYDDAQAILGSTSVQANSEIWLKIVRAKCNDAALLVVADSAFLMFAGLARGRNDFVHAVFALSAPDSEFNMTSGGPEGFRMKHGAPIAVRTKTGKRNPVANLVSVRDDACRLSYMLAHIDYALSPSSGGKSPWRDKF